MCAARPNFLIITTDQYRYPRFSYGAAGFIEPLKQILGFLAEADDGNPYWSFFPGLKRLHDNGVLLATHTIAASACTPSRATIYTGQYGTRTGVTQTDGLFKNGDSDNFPWLAEGGIPTLGSWMREAGYTTHYFGKWHVSNPPDHSLNAYGFDNWEESYPEPHGAAANNLGLYRDLGFADSACAFINRKALAVDFDRVAAEVSARDPLGPQPTGEHAPPWLAVVSLTNPHDVATYPGVLSLALPAPGQAPDPGQTPTPQPATGPLTIPGPLDRSLPPFPGTKRIALNPLDLEQECATNAPSWQEDLSAKPDCQAEYVYKMGLALASKLGFNAVQQIGIDNPAAAQAAAVGISLQSTIPFALSADPEGYTRQFIQIYAWLHTVVDPHIDRVLQTLEDSGMRDNTYVVFLADHGEYAGAHNMMMEKWHTAYQEALHVPVVFQLNPERSGPLQRRAGLTSHIDLLPTILGLAGLSGQIPAIRERLQKRHSPVPPLPGADLSGFIRGTTTEILEPDGSAREGVLFITSDEITAPLPPSDDPHDVHSMEEFDIYCKAVDVVIHGTKNKTPVAMTTGPVCQPCHVHAVRTARYKLARTFAPPDVDPPVAPQWECYDLQHDDQELYNLADLNTTPPVPAANLPSWADPTTLGQTLTDLNALLERLETRCLSTSASW